MVSFILKVTFYKNFFTLVAMVFTILLSGDVWGDVHAAEVGWGSYPTPIQYTIHLVIVPYDLVLHEQCEEVHRGADHPAVHQY